MIGKTLAHYEITSLIGKGGMGEVYQAKDLKLGRNVAVKVLPEEFAQDADRVARFQREAKLLASLNHANIAGIHGLDESDGTHFLVLELVEGETLAGKIKAGPIPVEDSLKLALQIAEALEAAHEKGVIHRDLKPANIKITPDGKVKVLDFGLAKAYVGDKEEVNLSNSPTLSNAATKQGVILGTAAYMSPEQARGEAVDKKADIWAFGVVLFEMLTGRGMFEGRTVSDTLAAVLMREPEWKRLPVNLHPRIRFLLERCLERESRNRYSGIGDARVDIQQVLAEPGGVFVQTIMGAEPKTRLWTMLPSFAAAIVLAAVTAGVAVWKLKPSEPRRVIRFDYDLPDRQFNKSQLFGTPLAVSSDGSQFVYGSPEGLYLRSMDALDARLIAGTDKDSAVPFFSPDGQWIGYHSGTEKKLKKIAKTGGAPITLCGTQVILGAVWYPDNTIVYAALDQGIMRVSAEGGIPETLIRPTGPPYFTPQILPGGKVMLFETFKQGKLKILAQSFKSGETKELFEGGDAQYLPTGHIVYTLEGNLLAVPFDPETLRTTGGPVSVIEDVGPYAVSSDGTLVFIRGAAGSTTPKFTLMWVDRKGKEEAFGDIQSSYVNLSLSPDGTRLALAISDKGTEDIWVRDLSRGTMTRLTFDESAEYTPIWTPDGKRIVFTSQPGQKWKICWKAADGAGEAEQLALMPDREIWPWSWSGDGKTLLLTETATNPLQADIGTLSIEGDRARKPLLTEKYHESEPKISADGRWMAYTSNESGQNEIYVRPFPEIKKARWQISTTGGHSPLWSRGGRELFYRSGDATMAVKVETEPAFKPGNPEILFRGLYYFYKPYDVEFTPWDISPDGKRFVMAKRAQPVDKGAQKAPPDKINIVVNWFEELKQKVPVK